MGRKKKNPEPSPVISWRVSPVALRQLDTLAELYGENRSQVLTRLVSEAVTRLKLTVGSGRSVDSTERD